ncbi:MAG: nitroreductase family protein [Acidimicrobiia bacterium]
MPAPMIPYSPTRLETEDQLERGRAFLEEMDRRRSVRFFSDEAVPRELIELAVRTASTAPSGAHKQPWTYVITGDPSIKRQIREAAEREERVNYQEGRLPEHWREDLEPLGTDWHKSFLETVPWVVVLFEQRYGVRDDGERSHHYYVKESVGISAGLFIAALHHMGLATLTHTPSPMKFLSKLLGRPENERPFCLFPIGYPADDCVVPQLRRKNLGEVMVEVGSTT